MVKTEGIFFGFGKSKNSQLRGEEFVGCSEVPLLLYLLIPNPSLAKNSLMTVIRNAASIDKAFSYVS